MSSLISCSDQGETQIIDTSHGTITPLSDMAPVYTDNRYSVYRFGVSSNGTAWIRPISFINRDPLQFEVMGWYSEENWNGVPTRWMQQNASLLIYAEEPGPVTLQFRALGYHNEKTLIIFYDNTKIYEETIPQDFTEIKVPCFLQKGMNIIYLKILECCHKPSEVEGNSDARYLCIAVQDLRIEGESTLEEFNQ